MVTKKDIRSWLDAEEVDYTRASRLGPEAVPLLMELVQDPNLGLASKATYLASLINTEQSIKVLEIAMARNEPLLRVAVASGIRNLPEIQAEKLLDPLIDDPDAGIRKVMLKSAAQFKSIEVEKKFQKMADKDSMPFVSELAGNIVKTMKTKRQIP
ncbi:HEAT repeat domain-containing protein [Planococcus sp. SE5232]|uniref:HEAT repeat domain-containing protein n=1 Tax=unclassified Planococcus (in: firmicutes) TaxID=2662419 RepID=UPI003D6C5B22